MKSVIEVDQQGNLIDELLMAEEDIEMAKDEGRHIILSVWETPLFEPKYNFENETWVEGLSNEEVAARQEELEEFNQRPNDTEMNAVAIMELSAYTLEGGE